MRSSAGACGETEFIAALSTVQTGGGGTISFDCGDAPFYIYFGLQKSITTAVTIDGGDLAILSGQNTARLFTIGTTASLTLKNLTVTNGGGNNGFFDGGAIYNTGSLTIDHCKFLNNFTGAANNGGAIVTFGPLTIKNNSEFAYNHAAGGGAVYPRFDGATTQISDSNFHHNTATGDPYGGGALLVWDGPNVVIENTIFDHNSSEEDDGGAIYITPNSSLDMKDLTLTSNSGLTSGGALIEGAARITDTLFANNTAAFGGGGLFNIGNTRLVNVLFNKNIADVAGGGIYNLTGAELEIEKSIFLNNSTNTSGGGIYAGGLVSIVNSFLAYNEGLYAEDILGNGNVSVNFSTILNPGAQAPGTAIQILDGTFFNLKNSIIQAAGDDCTGSITSQGFNIGSDNSCSLLQVSDKPNTDPKLGLWISPAGAFLPLPKVDSPALDSGQCGGVATDIRGFSRPVRGCLRHRRPRTQPERARRPSLPAGAYEVGYK